MYDRDNDVSRLFLEDSREKKRTGIGIHKRASRRGYIRGGIRTQSDFLSNKEKKKLNGEVRVYSMYDMYKDLENCNLEEILSKEDSEVTKILTIIKQNNTSGKIGKKFGLSQGKLYGYYRKYGVYIDPKPNRTKATATKGLITKEKFALLDTIDKRKYIGKILSETDLSYRTLAAHFGVSYSSIQYHVKKLEEAKNKNVEVNQIEFEEKEAVVENNSIAEAEVAVTSELKELQTKLQALEAENKKLLEHVLEISKENAKATFKGLKIDISGDYTKEDLSNRLLSLDGIMIESRKYRISLSLEEILN